MPCLEDVITSGLADPEAGWNMGSFGAIAEFHHVAGDPPPPPPLGRSQVTARGAIRIERLDGVRPVAYEGLSPKPHRWTQGIALCLPRAAAVMARRDVLTELGSDDAAMRAQDCGAILFDLGLAQPQVDFCIRTADPALLAVLRSAAGRSLLESGNPAMPAILSLHPHRVALTRLGRVEVYQKIGGPDTGGAPPEGPHTHVLPELLRSRRTHSANTPVPEGWLPCAGLHPENPVIGRLGEDKPFDPDAFAVFQALLSAWGPRDYLAAKAEVGAALQAGRAPQDLAAPRSRIARAGLRNAIRQWRRQYGDSPLALAWAAAFDRPAADGRHDPDIPGH